jgi:hypothetical protein
MHWLTEVQGVQTEWSPTMLGKNPGWHCVHCESVAFVQVSCVAQLATGAQVTQESATPAAPPSWRNEPLTHCVHCESDALVHVSALVQNVTGLHWVQV